MQHRPPSLGYAAELLSQGQPLSAISVCTHLLSDPEAAPRALELLAEAHAVTGRVDLATRCLARLVQLQPDNAGALRRLGSLQLSSGAAADARASLLAALELEPAHARTLNNLGHAQIQLGKSDEAIASLEAAIRFAPDYTIAHFNLGSALLLQDRPQQALECFARAVRIDAGFAQAHIQCAQLLLQLGRPREALEYCDHALGSQGVRFEVHNLRGIALSRIGEYQAAIDSFNSAIMLRPDNPDPYCNRGAALRSLERREDALASYREAIALDPSHAESYNNLATLLCEQHDLNAALSAYDRAIEIKGDYARAHLNRAYALLLTGNFERGWPEHERQYYDASGMIEPRTRFAQSVLRGDEPLAGTRLLVHSEQGFGDTIQFCRYAPALAAAGAEVFLQVQPSLKNLMASLPGISRVAAEGEQVPNFDYQCSLLRLPFIFRTTLSTIPATVPYLRADPERIEFWRRRLGERRRPRIGLVWAAGFRPNQPERWALNRRNIPLAKLAPWRMPGIEFFSLQKGQPAEAELAQLTSARWTGPEIVDHTEWLRDFSDTAALIENLDLVISVDSAVAHLAGALAKPVWIPICFDNCWRWLLERRDSPWYPSARLFRQPRPGDWDPVIGQVKSELATLHAAVSAAGEIARERE